MIRVGRSASLLLYAAMLGGMERGLAMHGGDVPRAKSVVLWRSNSKYSPRECTWTPKAERPTRSPLHEVERARRFLLQQVPRGRTWGRRDIKRCRRLRSNYKRTCRRAGVWP